MTTMITMFAEPQTEITTRANLIYKNDPQKIAAHIKFRTASREDWYVEHQDITLHMTVAQFQAMLSSLTTTFFDLLNELPAQEVETANG